MKILKRLLAGAACVAAFTGCLSATWQTNAGFSDPITFGYSGPAAGVFLVGTNKTSIEDFVTNSRVTDTNSNEHKIDGIYAYVCYPAVPSGAYARAIYTSIGTIASTDANAGCTSGRLLGNVVWTGAYSLTPEGTSQGQEPYVSVYPGETLSATFYTSAEGWVGSNVFDVTGDPTSVCGFAAQVNSSPSGLGTQWQTWS